MDISYEVQNPFDNDGLVPLWSTKFGQISSCFSRLSTKIQDSIYWIHLCIRQVGQMSCKPGL